MLLLRRFIIFCFLQIFYAPKNFRKKMILISHSHKIFFAVLDLSVVVVSLGVTVPVCSSAALPPSECGSSFAVIQQPITRW
jgi:dihydroxyacetone kinase DhaKLM complex PTS-EIIA-like component DhaM